MPEPEINTLQPDAALRLDKIRVLTNRDDGSATPKLVEFPAAAGAGPPLAPTKRRNRKRTGPPFLQFEEVERLFRVITSVRDRSLFRLAYHAGLRASEVGMLDLRDYNARTDCLFIHRLKGSNSGDHHLCREESRTLKAWLKIRGSEPGILFPSRKNRPISRQMLDVLMKQYGAAAQIPAALRHFHVLKHSCATHLLSKGFHVEQVQDWIGHANIQNTMIYAHITNSRRDEMAAALRDTWK
jgi:integrase